MPTSYLPLWCSSEEVVAVIGAYSKNPSLMRTREVRMPTSKKDASKASKQLKSNKSTPAQKSVAGSDLAQAKKTKSTKKK